MDASLIVMEFVSVTTVPLILSVLIATVNVSIPFSVVASAVGVTVNEPELLSIKKLPEETSKSPELDSMVHQSSVLLSTFVVDTLIVKG